jgi:very-short-patch-repair endonuclease
MQLDASTPRDRARRLRRDQTETERRLWTRLRARQFCGAKFRRQHPIGRFVADFCCLEHGLVVELDGGGETDRPHDSAECAGKSG